MVQILLAIFAVEALGQFNQVKDGAAPGDLGFDPLNLKPSDPETWEKVQVCLKRNNPMKWFQMVPIGDSLTEYVSV